MKRLYGRPNPVSKLCESVHQHLNMYAISATAAGVSLLALAQPSEAKIIYRHTHVVIGINGVASYNLDLNHDGITDFTIREESFATGRVHFALLYTIPRTSNGAVGGKGEPSWDSALHRGAKIGPRQAFVGQADMAAEKCISTWCSHHGPWWDATNRYLGVKFMIKGKTHYGWARLSVHLYGYYHGGITATLTGYAYEDIRNKPIIAGRTKGADDPTNNLDSVNPDDPGPGASLTSPIPDPAQPASLGMLALGAQSVPLRRRKESVAATTESNYFYG